jgi:hypothetical protein
MNTQQSHQTQIHQNVMELLVAQEVEQQMRKVSPKIAMYINHVEVATYALNRLPPLYASCEEGKRKQQKHGQEKYRTQISIAVRQAILAVQRDPLRLSTPLKKEQDKEFQIAQAALQTIKHLLQENKLSRQNLIQILKQSLTKTARQEVGQTNNKIVPRTFDWNDSRYRL